MGASVQPVPQTPDEAEFQKWKVAHAPVTHDDAEFQQWKAAQKKPSMPTESTRALPFNRPNPTGDIESLKSLPTAALGAEASLMRGLPPLALAQNAVRALARGQSYADAKSDIDTATGMLHPVLRGAIEGVGALPAAMMMPSASLPQIIGSQAAIGASSGVDDPSLPGGERLKRSAIGAGIAAGTAGLIGGGVKATNAIRSTSSLASRIKDAPTLGESALEQERRIKALDTENYGQAKSEGNVAAQRPTPKAVLDAFSDPDIAPYVEKVRGARRFKNSDDASVGREAYKQMSREQRSILDRIQSKGEYDADLALKADNLASAKNVLKTALSAPSENPPITFDVPEQSVATEPQRVVGRPNLFGLPTHTDVPGAEIGAPEKFHVPGGRPGADVGPVPAMRVQTAPAEPVPAMMPSLPPAIATHAQESGLLQRALQSADDAKRFMDATSIPAKRVLTRSPEAVLRGVTEMSPEEAQKSLQFVLGRGKEAFNTSNSHGTAFGAVRGMIQPAQKINRLRPLVNQLDVRAGNETKKPTDVSDILRLLGITTAASPFNQ